MVMKSLHDLFRHQLHELYGAEMHSENTLTKMAGAALAAALRDELEVLAHETDTRLRRLDDVFTLADERPAARTSRCFVVLMDHCSAVASEPSDVHVRDVAMLALTQSIKLNKIAGYDVASTLAAVLKHTKARELLKRSLKEELASHRRLKELADTLSSAAMCHAAVA